MAQKKVTGPVVLLILDGVGSYKPYKGNAVALGNTPTLARLWDSTAHTLLFASAEYVGLPEGVKGNSEVGHTNIGAGRVVFQDLPRINKAIENGNFFESPILKNAVSFAKANNNTVHLMGNLSDGSVHSTIEHLRVLLQFFRDYAPDLNVYIHAFTDGRDAPPKSAPIYFKKVDSWINEYKVGRIASIVGRQYAMDRNFTWPRTQLAYDLLTKGKGTVVSGWEEAVKVSYEQGITDEFFKPFIIKDNGNIHTIKNKDVVIFFNYRPDRAVQLTKAFVEPTFMGFDRGEFLKDLFFITMTRYSKDLEGLTKVLFPPDDVRLPMGNLVSSAGMRQLRLAESQKYPHVTYFFNGGTNVLYPGEDRVKVPSPNVPTFDLKPEMSIYEVVSVFEERIKQGVYDFFVINFANGDMVGHSGNLVASMKAMEHVDRAVKKVANLVLAHNGLLCITADHGNVEEVINEKTGGIDTEHSIYPVPFMMLHRDVKHKWLPMGKLADVAPTLLYYLGIDPPSSYTGRVLV